MEPKKTLKKEIVIGPKDSVAILILKKAEDQIKAKTEYRTNRMAQVLLLQWWPCLLNCEKG
jgi:hypothetical protein